MRRSIALSRRKFMATAGLVVAAGLSPTAGLAAFPQPRRWIVSSRDVGLKDTGMPDCWTACKELGLGGVEIAIEDDLSCPNLYHPNKSYSLATEDGVKRLMDDLAAAGVVVTAFARVKFSSESRLDKDIAVARRLIPAAQKLGVKAIRVDTQARKLSPAEFLPVAIRACKRFTEVAEGSQFILAVENHGRNTNDPEFFDKLVAGVNSKNIGQTLDPNNFYWYGWPLDQVYKIYKHCAPRVVHTHCKNVRYPASQRNVRRPMDPNYREHSAPLYEGDIDYRRVAAILRQANYQNDLCLENECLNHFPPSEHLTVLKREIALLKSLA